MNEVEKMYSNAGVKYYESVCSIKRIFDTKFVDDCNFGINCYSCPLNKSPFTAEKQLELIKWLMNNPKDFFSWTIQQQGKDIKYAFYVGYEYGSSGFLEFTEALADIVNDLWQDLTDADKAQIKEILE